MPLHRTQFTLRSLIIVVAVVAAILALDKITYRMAVSLAPEYPGTRSSNILLNWYPLHLPAFNIVGMPLSW